MKKKLSVSVDIEVVMKLEEISKKRGVSVSELVENALRVVYFNSNCKYLQNDYCTFLEVNVNPQVCLFCMFRKVK